VGINLKTKNMILILIGMVIGIAIAIYQTYNGWLNDLIDYITSSFIGILLGGALALIVAIMLPMDTYDKNYSLNIETLQDNNSVSGNFFLGCGQIEGKMKYVFYYEENGLYRMMQLDYNLVQIKYSDGKPKVNVTENYPSKAFINNFAIDLDAFDKTYIIEVPKGTIKNNYNLDAQ
jgi:hypothetical protein